MVTPSSESSDPGALDNTTNQPDTQTETVDWEAKFRDSEARAAKLENDLKSQRGRRKDMDDLRMSIDSRFADLQEQLGLVAEASFGGEPDSLRAQIQEKQAQVQQRAAATELESQHARYQDRLSQAINGPGGEPLLDLNNAPELAEARRIWNEGVDGKDASGRQLSAAERTAKWAEAVAEASIAVRGIGAPSNTTQPQAAPSPESSSAMPADLGAGAGGTGSSLNALLNKNINNMTQSELVQYQRDLDAAFERETGTTMRRPPR
ncbi:MAG: hypothetical protein GWN86_06895 [Desulfobacterales bacterium]|nr:hypothetical protein [Desulfobacterales bacterium]